RPGRSVDRTIHAAATKKGSIGRVHDGIDCLAGDIPFDNGDFLEHGWHPPSHDVSKIIRKNKIRKRTKTTIKMESTARTTSCSHRYTAPNFWRFACPNLS